ncbi:MAG: PIN domain-containing protein [Eggerthellaceae bacterium]|nr:PIN domain-containing protein [Eggerthellaceae bacterium]
MRKQKLLLDTNVVLDYIGQREPFYSKARLLMLAGRVGEFSLWISSSQVTDMFFILTDGGKKSKVPEVLENLRLLRMFVNVWAVTDTDIDKMLATTWPDPEGALFVDLALKMHADAIITRDEEFPHPDGIRVHNCDEFFAWMRDEMGIDYDEIPY